MPAEANLVHKIVLAVRRRYPQAWVVKVADRFTRGVPDLLILYWRECPSHGPEPGTLFVECKAPTGRLSPIQVATHEKIRDAGGRVVVAMEADDVLNALDDAGALAGKAVGS